MVTYRWATAAELLERRDHLLQPVQVLHHSLGWWDRGPAYPQGLLQSAEKGMGPAAIRVPLALPFPRGRPSGNQRNPQGPNLGPVRRTRRGGAGIWVHYTSLPRALMCSSAPLRRSIVSPSGIGPKALPPEVIPISSLKDFASSKPPLFQDHGLPSEVLRA